MEYLDFISKISKVYSDEKKIDILKASVFSIYE